MQVVNYNELQHHLKTYLDNVTKNHDTLIVQRNAGKSAVIISLEEFNSIRPTLHLTKSEKNRSRLMEALERANNGASEKHDLIEH